MNRKGEILKPIALVTFLVTSAVLALRISPGSFTVQDIPMGRAQDLGVTLVCNAEDARFVLICIMSPDIPDMPHCVGYAPLPDTTWFHVDDDTLETDSTGTARSRLIVDIPDRPELYNQHFVVRLFITAAGSGMFQPAIIPYYFIETPPDANPQKPPIGKVAVAPSAIDMTYANPTGTFRIFNNDTLTHFFRLTVRNPQGSSRRFPNLSPNFAQIGDTLSLMVNPESISVSSKQSKNISVRWMKSAALDVPSEAIILIMADDSTSNFVRVRMRKEKSE